MTAKRIFLSYGHDEHASLTVRLKRDLEARSQSVWFDPDRLKTGTKWTEYIEEGLDFVASVKGESRFLLLMAPHSVGRPRHPHGCGWRPVWRARPSGR